jgi:hypothetical protein
MIRFNVFDDGKPAASIDLDHAYLVGTDRVPLRADLKFARGQIVCSTQVRGAAALAIPWPVPGMGRLMMETTRLMERKEPYNLHVELARGQLMRISQKREDWGLYDFPDGQAIYDDVAAARDLLVNAITADNDAAAARQGDAAIAASVKAGEALGLFHADVFLERRREQHQFGERPFGCRMDLNKVSEPQLARLADSFDFVSLPMSWGLLEQQEGNHQAAAFDPLVKVLRKKKVALWGHGLVSLHEGGAPAWIQTYADDYERLREYVARHIKAVVRQLGAHVTAWEVVTGIHAHNAFNLSFEQLTEISRLATTLVRQTSPRSTVMLGIVMPWGEYYARDPRTIPPNLYAEMAVQSGINFDAFAIEITVGTGRTQQIVRDTMQISAMLDRFGSLGKPLHVIFGAPSVPTPNGSSNANWSEESQATWAESVYRIALSKPFVETVTWDRLSDGAPASPDGGLLRADLTPKPAYDRIRALREKLMD